MESNRRMDMTSMTGDKGFTAALSFLLWSAVATAAHAVERPQYAVQRMLEERAIAAYPDADIEVSVAALDSRLRLADCSDLQITPRGQQQHGRISIALKCQAPTAWSVFMTAEVRVMLPVITMATPLPRGAILEESHLTTSVQDISRLRTQRLLQPVNGIGMQLKRPLSAGSVVYLSALKQPLAIRRGEKITIIASRGSVQISVPGESLDNGQRGEQIRVRNRQSEKIIHAWVRGPGIVETFPSRQPPSHWLSNR